MHLACEAVYQNFGPVRGGGHSHQGEDSTTRDEWSRCSGQSRAVTAYVPCFATIPFEVKAHLRQLIWQKIATLDVPRRTPLVSLKGSKRAYVLEDGYLRNN